MAPLLAPRSSGVLALVGRQFVQGLDLGGSTVARAMRPYGPAVPSAPSSPSYVPVQVPIHVGEGPAPVRAPEAVPQLPPHGVPEPTMPPPPIGAPVAITTSGPIAPGPVPSYGASVIALVFDSLVLGAIAGLAAIAGFGYTEFVQRPGAVLMTFAFAFLFQALRFIARARGLDPPVAGR